MNPIPVLSDQHQNELKLLENQFSRHLCPGISFAISGGTLILIGGIFIVSACLCLTLPNVNVIMHVILPGVLPGVCAILSSIPLLTFAMLRQRKMTQQRKACIDKYEEIVKDPAYALTTLSEKEGARFLWEILMNKDWNSIYKEEILSDLKKRLPEEENRSEDEKKFVKMCEEAKKRT